MSKSQENYKINFIDLDTEIEHKEASLVTDIFNIHGEDYFRRIEKSQLSEFLKNDSSFIMATGGGTPCYENNLIKMKENGITIFLDVGIEEIIERLSHSSHVRPLLKRGNLKEYIEELYYKRLETYFQAHIILTGSNIVSQTVISALNNFKT